MGQVTHDQANLLLRLYELRRDPRMREAREWFVQDFSATTMEELFKKYPPGSEENASFRMVVSYWDMCAGMVNRGLIDDEFFFENGGEAWLVYDKTKELAVSQRKGMGNPLVLKQLEVMGTRMDAWRERTAPGFNQMMRERLRQFTEARQKRLAKSKKR
ncbi:MAG TPA: hypothetical protein VJW51_03740 [Candidatus Acidoferrales bacterium]|nr:hypothetical protein [Candidatus Acidoferrales bacterium]